MILAPHKRSFIMSKININYHFVGCDKQSLLHNMHFSFDEIQSEVNRLGSLVENLDNIHLEIALQKSKNEYQITFRTPEIHIVKTGQKSFETVMLAIHKAIELVTKK